MKGLSNLKFYVLSAVPKKGEISFRALLGAMRHAEILFSAQVAFERRSEPEPISLSKSDFCELLVGLASEGLLEALREETITMKALFARNGIREEISIGTKYIALKDFTVKEISDLRFRRTGSAGDIVADPLNMERFGEFTIPDTYRPLLMNVAGMKKWAPYFFAFFLGVFLLISGVFVWWYFTDQINLTTFLVMVAVFWASGASACAIGRKRRHSEPVIVRRIRVID